MVYVPRGGRIDDEFEIDKYNLVRESKAVDELTGEPPSAGLFRNQPCAGNLLVDDSFSMD